jgi:hypothetical protein
MKGKQRKLKRMESAGKAILDRNYLECKLYKWQDIWSEFAISA